MFYTLKISIVNPVVVIVLDRMLHCFNWLLFLPTLSAKLYTVYVIGAVFMQHMTAGNLGMQETSEV